MLQSCVFCNINIAINCCEEFEKSTKCSKVNLERVLENDPNDAMTKMLKLFDIYKNLNAI